MKTILCPTDFSPASENAIRYALEMSKIFNARLILFHSYHMPVPATEIPAFLPDLFELENIALGRLEELRAKMKEEYPSGQSVIELVVAEGDAVAGIEALQKKEQVNLIISGTKGASGLRKIFSGTNSARITVRAGCPVITVPEGSKFRPLQKIVFATNYAEGDFGNIEQVVAFAKPFNAQVIMLHISEGNLDKTAEFAAIEHFKQRIGEETGYSNLVFKLIENKDVEEGILNYLDEVKADMLAMTNRHRTFFQKLFERSLTKQIAFETQTPLIAFHTAEQEVNL